MFLAVDVTRRYYEDGDASVLPRSIATRDAFENAMALDVAMGGSTLRWSDEATD